VKRKRKVGPRANPGKLRRPQISVAELKQRQRKAIQLSRQDTNNAGQLGDALIAVKAGMKHGDFKTWLRKNDIDRNRASYCMRLVQGKISAAHVRRLYQPTPQAAAISRVKKTVDGFLTKYKTETKNTSIEQISDDLANVCFSIVSGIAELREGWKVRRKDDPTFERATAKFRKEVEDMMAGVFVTYDMDEMDKLTNADMPRASDYMPKKPATSEKAKMQAISGA
jgi:hypothetical protein